VHTTVPITEPVASPGGGNDDAAVGDDRDPAPASIASTTIFTYNIVILYMFIYVIGRRFRHPDRWFLDSEARAFVEGRSSRRRAALARSLLGTCPVEPTEASPGRSVTEGGTTADSVTEERSAERDAEVV
jgi:hypothetical protein